MEDRWLSVDEICKYLGIGKDTVYKWNDKHGMPAHRMGPWKFKKDQVDAWVEAGGADVGCNPSGGAQVFEPDKKKTLNRGLKCINLS